MNNAKQENVEDGDRDFLFYGSAIPELGRHCRMRRLPRLIRPGSNVLNVDTVMACKFFPGPVSRIAGMPDTAPSGAVFFIPSAIFTPLP
ncbi:hypothetical protein, partial [Escherichia coli]|uniref:hypothetical protein n=3 Tax=Escherichia coli TaxID=562 RepID=UPI001BC8A379